MGSPLPLLASRLDRVTVVRSMTHAPWPRDPEAREKAAGLSGASYTELSMPTQRQPRQKGQGVSGVASGLTVCSCKYLTDSTPQAFSPVAQTGLCRRFFLRAQSDSTHRSKTLSIVAAP